MFCINCGKKLQDGALFCDQCGRRISGAGECEPGTQPVQQQYSPYYGAHRNNVSANYEERKAKRAVCNFVIFRTFVYVFLILYTIATRFDFIYSCMGIEASVRQVESLWQEIGGKVTFWGVFVIILLLSYMVLVAMLAYNESFSKKHSFTQFKGMLTGDIFEGIVLIICGFILCFGLYDSSGGMYKILDGYQMYYQEKYFPAGLLVIIIGVGILLIIGGCLSRWAIGIENAPKINQTIVKLSGIASGTTEYVSHFEQIPVSETQPDSTGIWICPQCGSRNSNTRTSCKDCGYYK